MRSCDGSQELCFGGVEGEANGIGGECDDMRIVLSRQVWACDNQTSNGPRGRPKSQVFTPTCRPSQYKNGQASHFRTEGKPCSTLLPRKQNFLVG